MPDGGPDGDTRRADSSWAVRSCHTGPMLALVLAILFCVAVGLGIVGYVLLEARREGRGGFWTAAGEELIAGARRTTEKVRHRGEQLGRTAAERTRDLAAKLPDLGGDRRAGAEHAGVEQVAAEHVAADPDREPQPDDREVDPDRPEGYRAAS